jgi:hypothetical protein
VESKNCKPFHFWQISPEKVTNAHQIDRKPMCDRIKELKTNLKKQKLSEDEEWMENAEKQFMILSDIAKLLKGEKIKSKLLEIEVRPRENDTMDDISPIAPLTEEHQAYSPENRVP